MANVHAFDRAEPAVGAWSWDRFWDGCKGLLSGGAKQFTVAIVPLVGIFAPVVVAHFQYMSAYQDKVREIGKKQMTDAEQTFTNVSSMLSEATTLQQLLYFNYRDAIKKHADGDTHALEAMNASAIYPKYNELRTNLREKIDLLARQVEMHLDWASDTTHDAANPHRIGSDLVTRIALGRYDFDCDSVTYMPDFDAPHAEVPPTPAMLKTYPQSPPLKIDWFSAKHQLLTLQYCFEQNHTRITAAREWAAGSTVDPTARTWFVRQMDDLKESLDRQALRLNAFMALSASAFEDIRVKFRPRVWYCHVPVVRQAVDGFSKKCSPIRTAQYGSMS